MFDDKRYVITEKIENSTHFLALKDTSENAKYAHLTPGKLYPFSVDVYDQDYIIINDIGTRTMEYMFHNGEYVRYKQT